MVRKQERSEERRLMKDEDEQEEWRDPESLSAGRSKRKTGEVNANAEVKQEGQSRHLRQMDGAADKKEEDEMDWELVESDLRDERVVERSARLDTGGFVEKRIEGMKKFWERPCCVSTWKGL